MPEYIQNDLLHAPESSRPPKRILLVDHDPYVCHLSADVLISDGYEVNAAADGAAGWAELQANHYHLLITEYDLPKLSGVKLVRKVRAARLTLRVVMIARKIPVHKLARNLSLQLSAALLKPLPAAALLDMVRIVLRATVSPCQQIASPPALPAHSPADGWQLKLIAAAASTTSQMFREINSGYAAYDHWGLNE